MKTQDIKDILNYGLEEIKTSIIREKRSIDGDLDHHSELLILWDEMADMLESPTEYIEELVGYAEDLKDELIKDMSPLERAMATLYFDQNKRKYLDRSLRERVKASREYKDLMTLLESKMAEY